VTRERGRLRLLWIAVVLFTLAGTAYPQSAPLSLLPATLPDGLIGQSYFASVSTTGGAPPISYKISSGGLPPGLTIAAVVGATTTADITGTTTATGTYNFVVQATDSVGSTATQGYSILVLAVLTVTTPPTLRATTAGASYSVSLAATGGLPPYTWYLGPPFIPGSIGKSSFGSIGRASFRRTAVASPGLGGLPPGFTLSSSGVISGVTSAPGAYSFQISVNDSDSSFPQSATQTFTLNVNPPPSITTPTPLPSGVVGTRYSIPLRAVAGITPYTWSLTSGKLPPGIALSPDGGLTGIPTLAGVYTFTVTVTDFLGIPGSTTFTLAITTGLSITTTSPLPAGSTGTPYSATFQATAGTPPYTWSVAGGTLPSGLTLDSAGNLTGTPTAAGSFRFTIQVTDAATNSVTGVFDVTIARSLTITPATLPDATLGTAYSESLTATGGTAPYTFTVDSGSLPGGITLASTGSLTGTPTAAGQFSFTARATDSTGLTGIIAYQLKVATAPPISPTITGVTDTEPPAQQPTLSVQLGDVYPVPLDGTMTLNFAPAAGNVVDPAIKFSNGKTTVDFTIPAGQTDAVFPNTTLSLGTGTVAGTITLTLTFQADGQDVTPKPAPTRVITIPAQAPVITKVTASHTGSGIEVDITGFSNTRDMTSATFTFQAATGTTLTNSQVTVTADQLFATWYNDPTSTTYGSLFTFAQPFTLSGNVSGIAGVSVTLTNLQGTSSAATATVQ